MRTLIRMKTFETNSSSTHTLVIPRSIEKHNKLKYFKFHTGEYGWGFDSHVLCDYLWTAILLMSGDEEYRIKNGLPTTEEWEEKIKKALSPYFEEVEFEYPTVDSWGWFNNCDIDHQSWYEALQMLKDVWKDEDLLVNAVLEGTAFTGNDNSSPEDNPYREEIENCGNSGNYEVY